MASFVSKVWKDRVVTTQIEIIDTHLAIVQKQTIVIVVIGKSAVARVGDEEREKFCRLYDLIIVTMFALDLMEVMVLGGT